MGPGLAPRQADRRHRRPRRDRAACSRDADVALVYGPERWSRGVASAARDLRPRRPGLVYVRCRPSRTASGAVDDYGLLVEARSGFCTQLAGHRPGPIFVDVRAPGAGAAFLLTTSVLALLRRRALDRRRRLGRDVALRRHARHARLHDRPVRARRARGRGVLGEGLDLPELPLPLRRRRAAPGLVRRQGHVRQAPRGAGRRAERRGLLHRPGERRRSASGRCGGGRSSPPARGTSGSSASARWASPCEPVFGPGEALADPHLAEIGLAVARSDRGHDDVVLATPIVGAPARRRPADRAGGGRLAARGGDRAGATRCPPGDRRRIRPPRRPARARLLGVRGRAARPPRSSPTWAPR